MSPGDRLPFGEMASARYSIGRREVYGWRRYREFLRVVDDAQAALHTGIGDRAGYYAIMGTCAHAERKTLRRDSCI